MTDAATREQQIREQAERAHDPMSDRHIAWLYDQLDAALKSEGAS